MSVLADALEAATRQPSGDDRERIAAILQLRHPGNMYSTCERDADAILAAGFSRASVPDAATENVQRMYDRACADIQEYSKTIKRLEAERDAALARIAELEAGGVYRSTGYKEWRKKNADRDISDLIRWAKEAEANIRDKSGWITHEDYRRSVVPGNLLPVLEQAEARIAEAAKLHQPQPGQGVRYCADCDQRWPCPTAVALGLNEGESDD